MSVRFTPGIAMLLGLLCACSEVGGGLRVDHGTIREPPPGTDVTAAYAELTNQDAVSHRVVAVESPLAKHIEIHESAIKDGMMRMRMLDSVPIPPGQTVELAPGDVHLMLFELAPMTAESYPVTFHLDNGSAVTAQFDVNRLGTHNR